MITKESFGKYEKYTISSEALSVTVTTLGATVLSLRYRDRETVLGYATPDEYFSHTNYLGAICGRVANRIKDSRFALNGREYRLAENENGNMLHGGPHAFDRKTWKAEVMAKKNAVRFSYLSPDGENGFPGNLNASVTYQVEGAKMTVLFEGDSDADTVFAPTTHMYFNLGDDADIRVTELSLPCNRYLAVDAELIPTRVLPVSGRFDFIGSRPIGGDYDTCFILDPERAPIAMAQSGDIRMTIRTDFPAFQLYTGQGLPIPHHPYQGFALEPEFYPDAPNRPDFPSVMLRAGRHFHRFAEYEFSPVFGPAAPRYY